MMKNMVLFINFLMFFTASLSLFFCWYFSEKKDFDNVIWTYGITIFVFIPLIILKALYIIKKTK